MPVTQHSDEPQQRPAAGRFAFASGSRPLDGYTIKRGVGRGGFGEVYFAVSDGGKEVALKLIRRNLEVELRGVTHCLNLKHPNLIALYDVRTDAEDNSWVVMEFVAGESLEDAVQRHPQGMPPAEALDWLRGIAAGVSYLHSHGIVHRDLKPANVFRDEAIVKLGDYGLAKFISCSRRSGQTESIGTVHYMAPEIANGRYGKEIDIYALGIMLYEMLTGRVPFDGESVGEVLMKHLTAQPDLSLLSEPYRTVVMRALAKDPDVRFSSVGELMNQLPRPQAGVDRYEVASYRAADNQPSSQNLAREPVAAAAVVAAAEEPVWRFVREQAQRAVQFWHGNLSVPAKVCVSIVGVAALLSNAPGWAQLTVTLVALYAAYRVGRWGWFLSRRLSAAGSQAAAAHPTSNRPIYAANQTQPAGALYPAAQTYPVAPAAALPPAAYPAAARRYPKAAVPLVVKSARERVAELTGSLLMSALAASILAVVMVLLRGQPTQPEQIAWLALCSTLGAWTILVPSKLWEGTKGEQVLRRFVMLVLGLGLGAGAFAVDQLLLVDLPFEMAIRRNEHIPASFYSSLDGSPLLAAYLAYFGFLLALVQWWRQADPRRPVRVSLWAVTCSVFAAWALNLFWPFPQPWGLMVAAVMSIVVQLSSPWMSDVERPTFSD